jgi:uncharacterized protein (TIGR03437 family)
VDAAGNLYVVDFSANRIRKVSTNGIITTVAGNGTEGFSGDGGPATNASLRGPRSVAVDAVGNLYIADSGNNRLRRVATNGIITSIAEGGVSGVAVDAVGNQYVGYGSTVKKITIDGIVSIIAGNSGGVTGDGGPAIIAKLNSSEGLAVDLAGNLYIADETDHRIRKVATNGTITTVAGNGTSNYSGDGGPATAAQLNRPADVALDRLGNLYIAVGSVIRKVSTSGMISTVAGNGTTGNAGDGGPATSAQLQRPEALVIDALGNLYIADSLHGRIRKVAQDGTITTVAGNGTDGYSGDGGPATNAGFSQPNGLAVDLAGNLYISDSYRSDRVRKVAANGVITTIAGNGSPGYSGDGGPAVNAQLNLPGGVAVDSKGNLYIADTLNERIRKVGQDGIITTVAGNGTGDNSGDGGPAIGASVYRPDRVAVDAAGNLYISSGVSRRIRKVATNGIITTIAGTGIIGYTGDGGPATSAQFNGPSGLAIDVVGNVYVSDAFDNAVRMLKPTASLLTVSAVANAASNLTGPIAPGEIVVVYGTGIGPAQLTQGRVDAQGRYGTTLSGTRVIFNGTAAPILYTWETQTSAIVPYDLGGTTASIQIEYQGVKSDPLAVLAVPSAIGLFTLDTTGKGQAAAINEDGSLNTAARPASRGTYISLYATGEGQTRPNGVDGQPATPPFPVPLLPVQVTIDGRPAEVSYAGGAPGIVAGVMQINVRIPANVQPGNVPVIVTVGGASSQVGVSLAVSGN